MGQKLDCKESSCGPNTIHAQKLLRVYGVGTALRLKMWQASHVDVRESARLSQGFVSQVCFGKILSWIDRFGYGCFQK